MEKKERKKWIKIDRDNNYYLNRKEEIERGEIKLENVTTKRYR